MNTTPYQEPAVADPVHISFPTKAEIHLRIGAQHTIIHASKKLTLHITLKPEWQTLQIYNDSNMTLTPILAGIYKKLGVNP